MRRSNVGEYPGGGGVTNWGGEHQISSSSTSGDNLFMTTSDLFIVRSWSTPQEETGEDSGRVVHTVDSESRG